MTLREGDERTAAERLRDVASAVRVMALANEFEDLVEELDEIATGLEVSSLLRRAEVRETLRQCAALGGEEAK